MGSFKFREADELVSALQNDVEGIILELQGEEVEEKGTGVPAGFGGSERDWYWLRNVGRDSYIARICEPISRVDLNIDNSVLFSLKNEDVERALENLNRRIKETGDAWKGIADMLKEWN